MLFNLTFPNCQYLPAIFAKSCNFLFISNFVFCKFLFPEVPVRFRKAWFAIWASMPKAPVDKDRNSLLGKCYIRLACHLFQFNLYPFIPSCESSSRNLISGVVFFALFALITFEVTSFKGIGALPSRRYFVFISMILTQKSVSIRVHTSLAFGASVSVPLNLRVLSG